MPDTDDPEPVTRGRASPDQTLVTLALLAYLHQARTGAEALVARAVLRSLEEALANQPAVAGDWTVVWGPALSKLHPEDVFYDNLMFVAKSTRRPDDYAVVVRGTPFLSGSAWIFEDFGVHRQVPWPYGAAPPEARIAHGTSQGLEALKSMTAPDGVPGAGSTLLDFLGAAARRAAGPVSLEVTGHSLGGTLCTPLALFLEDARAGWDPAGAAGIGCTSFAGLTPGNRAFAAFAEGRVRTRRVVNSKDLAPLAWNEATMAAAPELYLPRIEMGLLRPAWDGLELLVRGRDYLQTEPQGRLQGEVDPSYKSFLSQFAYQHLCAYPILLGVPEVLEILPMFPCPCPAPAA